MKVTIEDDRIIKVIGDRDDPISKGYACFKGLQAFEQHYGESRLLHSLRRQDGQLVAGPVEDLLTEAGQRLKHILDEYGPESVALFQGTQAIFNNLALTFGGLFTSALNTPRMFTTMTIDQSAKWIGEARMGGWAGGLQTFEDADTWMLFGSNPLVSMVAAGGPNQFVFHDPVKKLKAMRDRGFQLVVIDPRKTETARFAELHIQPMPGHDAEIAAAILFIILKNDWHDKDFCCDYVSGLEDLRAALKPFQPDRVAKLAGIDIQELVKAAEIFAHHANSGMAGSGTGPNMARHSNVAEHLIQTINVICGRFPRSGTPVSNSGVLTPKREFTADVTPVNRSWEVGPKTRSHGLGTMKGAMMSAEISDEILLEGEGKIRALICVGGNLAVALPDQQRAEKALDAIDLLIVLDPRITATSRFADYVFAPKLQYERPDHTGVLEGMFQVPIAHRTAALVEPPEGSEVVDDWYVLWRLAEEAGFTLKLGKAEPGGPPSSEAMLKTMAASSRIPIDKVSEGTGAHLISGNIEVVGERTSETKFELLAPDVADEIAQVASEIKDIVPDLNLFKLIVRRHREVMNSTGADFNATFERFGGNPTYLNPGDIKRLDLQKGEAVEIVRNNIVIQGHVVPDKDVREGLVSMSHAWAPNRENPWEATNALVDADIGAQSINRMPIMTGIEVCVRKAIS